MQPEAPSSEDPKISRPQPSLGDDANVLDLIHDSIVSRKMDGEILFWNLGAERLYGFRRDQAVGQIFESLLKCEYVATTEEMVESLLQRDEWMGETSRVAADGAGVTVDARWVLRRDADGSPVEIIETTRLVSKRGETDEALRISEHRYRNLFAAMAASFWEMDFFGLRDMLLALRVRGITDLRRYFAEHPEFVRDAINASRVVDVNEKTLEVFGATHKEELLHDGGRFWPVTSEGTFAEAVIHAVEGKPYYSTETKMLTLDGREIDVLFTACFPFETHGRGTLLVGIIDITDRKKTERKLEAVQAELAHAARISVLGELTASIAHEVNQPLASIKTNGEAGLRWLNRDVPDLDEAKLLFSRMVDDAGRAANIIDRIKSMAANKKPQRTPLDLNGLIREAILCISHELNGRGVDFTLLLQSDLPEVSADRTQLQQVLINLAINAAQAMAETASGHRHLTVESTLGADGVVVRVVDTGPGLNADAVTKLFDSFFTTKPEGLGLGLPICRTILASYGGRIWAENNAGAGSTFSFALAPLP